jgi:hypothetical protein
MQVLGRPRGVQTLPSMLPLRIAVSELARTPPTKGPPEPMKTRWVFEIFAECPARSILLLLVP